MILWLKNKFWTSVARIILKNRLLIILIITGITVFLGLQWKNIQFTFKEANMLPDHHPVNVEYQKFLDLFGEEGNVIVMAVDNPKFYTPEVLNRWHQLSRTIDSFPEIEGVLSTENLKELTKDNEHHRFALTPILKEKLTTQKQVNDFTQKIFDSLPFYKDLLYNKQTKTMRMGIYMHKEIVNTKHRKDFILNQFIPVVEEFEKDTNLDVRISGMPYIRTLSAQSIVDEMGLFIAMALLTTSLIFFFFFRSFRAMFISMAVVLLGVMWSFGLLGLTGYKITVLTAIIPPLIIVIGIPNCIFLINKYQSEIIKHGNQAKALQRVIRNVGNVTLLTNLTTSAGFATFIFTESSLLKEFGIIASVSILAIFVISLLVIPIIYSYMKVPKAKHLRHLNKKWVERLVVGMEKIVKNHRFAVYSFAVGLLVLSIIGIYKIHISGSLIEDMPKGESFFDDIVFFENEFGGIMPLEITIDTKRKNGITRPSTLKRIDEFEEFLSEIPQISKPISIVNLVKYTKQAYYNGNPKYYDLPTSQERNFILSYIKKSEGTSDMLKSYVDSTGQVARITTFMKDIGTEKMAEIEEDIHKKAEKLFPADQFDIHLTGTAYMFTKGTTYLVKNLVISLAIAIILIAFLMAYMFRSFRMILISLVPNILPLLITAGMMGFLGIPLKPSTILVFSIAFGISVDDTIHFLAKYRQELVKSQWKMKKSVYLALHETGISMFYTSIVLFFGFSVFMISSFGGTKALGGLISITLLFAMMTNLLLLPSLLLSLEKRIYKKKRKQLSASDTQK